MAVSMQSPASETTRLSRRTFLVCAGMASCGVAFALSGCGPRNGARSRLNASVAIGPWVTLHADGAIEILAPGIELGQGAMTALPRLLAEELDADWGQVRVVPAPADEKRFGNPLFWDIQITAGSRTTAGYHDVLRIAGAQARHVLLLAAADMWKAAPGELDTASGMVIHRPSGRRASYGELVPVARVPKRFPAFIAPDFRPQLSDDFFGEPPVSPLDPAGKPADAVKLKSRGQYRLLGVDTPRLDIPCKVNGRAEYGLDVQLPDMLYAMVEAGPVQGGEPSTVDDAAARKVHGIVEVLRLPYGVAVVGTSLLAVRKARELVRIGWKPGPRARAYSSDKTLDEFSAIARDPTGHPGVRTFEQGDQAALVNALADGHHSVAFEIRSELVYHATLEPQNATLRLAPDGRSAEAWVGTQWPRLEQDFAARVLGLPSERITLHTLFTGGSYGRRQEPGAIVDAAHIARAVKRPVKVIWTREDDIKRNPFRQALLCRAEAAVDPAGKLLATRHRIVADSWFARFLPEFFGQYKQSDPGNWVGGLHLYDVPLQAVENVTVRRDVDVCYLRGVGVTQVKFAQECLIELIARRHGRDPLAFRLEMLKRAPRAIAVLEAVARMADWGRTRAGTALGLSYIPYSNSHAALIAEVSVRRETGEIRVHNVWCAVDAGFALQPAILASQMEGGILQGMSMALYERITVRDGVVQQSNFHDYPILRMSQAPEINVQVISTDNAVSGCAEIGVMPVAPAINNALARLIGRPLAGLPMRPEHVLGALQLASQTHPQMSF